MVEDDPPANVEAGVNRVVKVGEMINLILESLESNSEQRIDLSGVVVSIRRTSPGNLLLFSDSNLCRLQSVP